MTRYRLTRQALSTMHLAGIPQTETLWARFAELPEKRYPFCPVSGWCERDDSQFIPFHPHLAGTRPGDDGPKEGLQLVADPVLAFIPKCP